MLARQRRQHPAVLFEKSTLAQIGVVRDGRIVLHKLFQLGPPRHWTVSPTCCIGCGTFDQDLTGDEGVNKVRADLHHHLYCQGEGIPQTASVFPGNGSSKPQRVNVTSHQTEYLAEG